MAFSIDGIGGPTQAVIQFTTSPVSSSGQGCSSTVDRVPWLLLGGVPI